MKNFSISALAMYRECPKKYFFNYVAGLWPSKTPYPLALGKVVHEGLAFIHSNGKKGLKRIVERYNEEIGGDLKKLRIEALEILESYKPIKVKPKHIELRFEVNLEGIDIPFVGVIDMITEDDEIIEHKTSSKRYTRKQIDTEEQVTGYILAFEKMFERKPANVFYNVLVKGKPEKNQLIDTNRTKQQLGMFIEKAKVQIEKIKKEKFEPKEGFYCRWCEHAKRCPTKMF